MIGFVCETLINNHILCAKICYANFIDKCWRHTKYKINMPITIIITNVGDKTGCGQVRENKVLTYVGLITTYYKCYLQDGAVLTSYIVSNWSTLAIFKGGVIVRFWVNCDTISILSDEYGTLGHYLVLYSIYSRFPE